MAELQGNGNAAVAEAADSLGVTLDKLTDIPAVGKVAKSGVVGLADTAEEQARKNAKDWADDSRPAKPSSAANVSSGPDVYGEMIGLDGPTYTSVRSGENVVQNKKLTAQLDRLRAEGHALERHGEAITDDQLYVRARTGVAPDGSKTRRGYTPTSTAFNSDELLVQADDFLRKNYLDSAVKNSEPGTLRVKVSADVGVEVGRGYIPVGKKVGLSGPLQKVDGLTNVEAWYVYDAATNIWQTTTIYPIPGK